MSLEAIVAVGRGGVIGHQGRLPWPRLPADMRHFREVTQGQTVVMGRKTAESLPDALLNRINLVVTRNKDWRHPSKHLGFRVRHTAFAARALYYTSRVIVIGGAEIYRLYAPHIDTLHVTVVHGDFAGDTFFPVDAFTGDWETVSEVFRPADENNAYDLTFATLRRIP